METLGGWAAVSRIDFHNSTTLSDAKLAAMCAGGLVGWSVGTIALYVRYSRTADFSGTCFYRDRRIHVNLGRHLVYPYLMSTNLARTQTVGRRWYKPDCRVELRDGYEVVLFVFMHELYHLLLKLARRNTRQKESMCDRFAARFLVEHFGTVVRGPDGSHIAREHWDFQNLDGFVAAARTRRGGRPSPTRRAAKHPKAARGQMLLFPL